MIIEYILCGDLLRKYRGFKADFKARLWQVRHLVKSLWSDRNLRRLSDSNFQPIFICGMAGSGTTLITALLDQGYENSICLRESARMLETSRLLWLDKLHDYTGLEEYSDALYLSPSVSVSRVRRAVLSTYRQLTHYPRRSAVVIDKAPNSHMVRIGKLCQSFRNAKVVMIFRDPLELIEGLVRKWPHPFGEASLTELCFFYNELHWQFLEQTNDLEDRLILSLDNLKTHSEAIIIEIATRLELQGRTENKSYRDRENTIGKGLRNVVDGKIYVDTKLASNVDERFSVEEKALIRNLTREVYETLCSFESLSVASKGESAFQAS